MTSLHLTLLGGFEARSPSGAPVTLPTKKTQALLAYLALPPGRWHTREELMSLLWSDRSDEQARNSLRQALSTLRRSLNDAADALITERDRIGLEPGVVDVDVLRLEERAQGANGMLEEVAALYRGDFLEGLSIRDPACEEWLRHERARLRQVAVDALARLSETQLQRGAADDAIASAQRLLDLDPVYEPAYRTLMHLYAARGQRGFALKTYQTCCNVLARELDIEPEAQTRELFEGIRNGDVSTESSPSLHTTPLPELVLPDKPSVVVIPFRNLGDSSDDYFSDGITEDIITGLSHFRELFVVGGPSAFTFRERDVEPARFARELGVQFVLQGSLRRSRDRVRVNAQLVDAPTGRHIWGQSYDRELHDILSVQTEVSQTLVVTLVGQIESVSRERTLRKHTASLDAYDYLLRGNQYLFANTVWNITRARQNFEKAVELDAEYATAYAHLAWTYLLEWENPWLSQSPDQALERGFELACKAIALDDSDMYGHWGVHSGHLYKKQYELAEKHLARALALNPNHPYLHCSKGWFLTLTGSPREGIESGETAYRLNPFAADDCLVALGGGYYTAREYDEALRMLKMVDDPSPEARALLAACWAQLGQQHHARVAVEQAIAAWDGIRRRDWARDWPYKNASDIENLLDGLRKAGLIS